MVNITEIGYEVQPSNAIALNEALLLVRRLMDRGAEVKAFTATEIIFRAPDPSSPDVREIALSGTGEDFAELAALVRDTLAFHCGSAALILFKDLMRKQPEGRKLNLRERPIPPMAANGKYYRETGFAGTLALANHLGIDWDDGLYPFRHVATSDVLDQLFGAMLDAKVQGKNPVDVALEWGVPPKN